MPRTDGAVRSRRDLRRAVEGFVVSLGSSPGAIATTLASLEVRGTPKSAGGCAIARYLQVMIGSEPTVTKVAVFNRNIQVSRSGRRLDLTISAPDAVTRFIRAFDSGCYPQLLDRAAPLVVEAK
jgi:hypothetical protein